MNNTPAQLKAAREILGWTREEVAQKLGMTKHTNFAAERPLHYRPGAADRLDALYESNGVEFTEEAPRVRLKPTRNEKRPLGLPTAPVEPSR
jgi:transcriptional regulator with XRE-family HTH domain